MAANRGPAEHAREAPGTEGNYGGETEALGQDVQNGNADRDPDSPQPARHLYLVHSSNAPRSHSDWAKPIPNSTSLPVPSTPVSKGMLDRSVQVQIGRMLRDVFADVAEEQVPDRFVTLLEALEAKEKQL